MTRNLIKKLLLSLILGLNFLIIPLASADLEISIGEDSDEAQGDVSTSDCANLVSGLGSTVGCDSQDNVTDFTEYTGSFEGPDSSGYDEALTKTTSARELIQTVVNFALSFLGLIATVVIIYGGVLYVTSRGDTTKTEEGKKAITYAVIGIVIILGSFALVNTLINATGGNEDELAGGGAGDSISEAGEYFDVEEVLDELVAITEDFVEIYQTWIYVNGEVEYMQSIEMPLLVDVTVTDQTLSGWWDWWTESLTGQDSEFEDQYYLIEEDDVDEYVDVLRKEISKIKSEVDSLSETYQKAHDLYLYLRSGSSAYKFNPLDLLFKTAKAGTGYEGTEGCSGREYENKYGELGLGWTSYEVETSALDDYICSYLDAIEEAAVLDYEEGITELMDRLDELYLLFDTCDTSLSDSGLFEICTLFLALDYKLEYASDIDNLYTDDDASASSYIRDFVSTVDDLYKMVQVIEFVKAKINASVTSGNVPLIVRFDALGSTDPSNVTIQDTQIFWNLNGIDENNDGDMYDDGEGVNIDYTYDTAGTYRVGVKIVSADNFTAAGIAFTTIVVEPRSSIIKLTVNGSEISDFSQEPFPLDKDSYKVTLSEAEEGIEFDAGESKDGSNEDLAYFSWDFGDGNTAEGPSYDDATQKHAYGEAGTYSVVLTVKDSTGVEDRKYLKIYVGSPAARISFSPDSGYIGTDFTFSGAESTTDVGQIVSYQWSASLDAESYTLEEDNGKEIDVEFDEPGEYTISLAVEDNSGGTDSDSTEVVVESQTPVAEFEYEVPDETSPGIYVFDATDSYDPDPKDTITYTWEIEGDDGQDWEILEEDEDGALITVQFLTVGEREITLTVADQHEGELQKSASAMAIIDVESVLDVDLETDAETYKLGEGGEAEVIFTVLSENAVEGEIAFGDGETEYIASLTSGEAQLSHTYGAGGVFNVNLTVLDENENRNEITRRVYVGSADTPMAVINVESDGNDIGFGDTLYGSTKTVFNFDASSSINTDGTSDDLSYSWNFGDGTTSNSKTVTHSFEEFYTFEVTLVVKDKNDTSLSSEATVNVTIEGIEPEIKKILVTTDASEYTTPLKVNVSLGAEDEDGEIISVKGWYYDLNDSATELGTVRSESTSFTLTINTKGEEGEELEYGFAAEVTDDDNNTVSSVDLLSESQIPTITVINGPNDVPTVGFAVDRTNIKLGEEITFSSTSTDSDGEIIAYYWDVEGDGFYNNLAQTESSLTYQYTQIYPDGVDVSLKVEDDGGASAFSDTVTIYVDANSEPPDAAFQYDIEDKKVIFTNNSTIDTENGASLEGIYWDFDTGTDEDGNGTTDDDVEALGEEDPSHTYEEMGTYSVKMTIVDSTGQSDSVTKEISVIDTEDPQADFNFEVDDKEVNFTNKSITDTDNGVDIRSYSWDFDSSNNSDEDGDTDDNTKSPSHEYEDYGTYEVTLTIVDTYGKTDSITKEVELEEPMEPLEAFLTSTPTANSSDQIQMTESSGYVTLSFKATGGSEDYSFSIDKNIFYDTEDDGVKENDQDHTAKKAGSWQTYFDKSYGQIYIMLTVTDNETGETATDSLQVTFPSSSSSANLLNATPGDYLFFLISALSAALFGSAVVYRNKPTKSLSNKKYGRK